MSPEPEGKRAKVDDNDVIASSASPVVDWETQAKQALSDLVVARDALQKLKAMLSTQIRMDSVSEKLARTQQHLAKTQRDLAARDAELASLKVSLQSRDFALHRGRVRELLAAQDCGLHIEHFLSELLRPPQLKLEFAETYPPSLEVPPHVRLRPAYRVRVVGEDRRYFGKLAILVHAVQDTIEIPAALEGSLGAPVTDEGVAAFVELKFATTSGACGGLPLRLRFSLCTDDAGGVIPIAGVEQLESGEFHVIKKTRKQ